MEKNKIKILFLLPSIRGGGAERVVLDVIRRLDRNIFQPALFLIHEEGVYWSEVADDVKVYSALRAGKSIAWNSFNIIKRFFSAAREYDIIVGSLELYTTYLAQFAGLFWRKHTVGWVHTELEHRLKNMKQPLKFINYIAIKMVYPFLTEIICVSKGAARSLNRIVNLSINRVKIVYNPIDFDRIENASNTMLNNVRLASNQPIILAVGRLEKEKNIPLLLRAYRILINRGVKYPLVILGQGPDRKHIENLINDFGILENVFIMGFLNNPYAWMKKAEILVCSSLYEGFGLVLVEAMRLRTPVVSTNCPSGPAEILEDGQHGILVPIDDEKALADAIERVLTEHDLTKNLIDSAYLRTCDFDIKCMMPQFEAIFKNLTR